MKGKTMSNQFIPIVLGVISAVIVFATASGRSLPLIGTPRAALIALTGGIGQVGASGRWASPLAILGYLLGAAILIVIIGSLAGSKLPFIAGMTEAVMAVGILMAAKYLIGISGSIFHWL
jgi:hypothetical protein